MPRFEPDPPSGTFEDGTVGAWLPVGGNCTLANTTVDFHSGGHALAATSVGLVGQTGLAITTPAYPSALPLAPGDYVFGGWARNASVVVDEYRGVIDFLDSGGAVLGSFIIPVSVAAPLSTWVDVGPWNVTAPAGTAFVVVQYSADSSTSAAMAAGQVVGFDDLYLGKRGGIVLGIAMS